MKILKDRQYNSMQGRLAKLEEDISKAGIIINDIEKGVLDRTYDSILLGDNPLAASLIMMRANIKKVKEEENERKWATEGLAKFADILRENAEDVQTLSYQVISNLVKYLNANQGGVFVLKDEDKADIHISLEACYAFERRKFLKKKIDIKEGMVGQCFFEKESMYLTDIPKDYVSISSGLGESNPKFLLLTPIRADDEVYGVIEIASFLPFKPFMISFVEKLCESVAASLKIARINERTKLLLLNAQSLAENMQNQEGELKQYIQELHLVQESLKQKDEQNHQIIQQLKQSYETILQQSAEREKALKKTKEELIRKLTGNNVLIDLAGRQRMLSQKIGFYTEAIVRGNMKQIDLLSSAIEMYEHSLFVIKNGGVPMGMTVDEILEKADAELLPFIEKIESLWNIYKSAANRIINLAKKLDGSEQRQTLLEEHIIIIEENGETLLKLSNDLLLKCILQNKLSILSTYK
jgi:hypothetical protein